MTAEGEVSSLQHVFVRVGVNCVFYGCKLRLELEDNVMKNRFSSVILCIFNKGPL